MSHFYQRTEGLLQKLSSQRPAEGHLASRTFSHVTRSYAFFRNLPQSCYVNSFLLNIFSFFRFDSSYMYTVIKKFKSFCKAYDSPEATNFDSWYRSLSLQLMCLYCFILISHFQACVDSSLWRWGFNYFLPGPFTYTVCSLPTSSGHRPNTHRHSTKWAAF